MHICGLQIWRGVRLKINSQRQRNPRPCLSFSFYFLLFPPHMWIVHNTSSQLSTVNTKIVPTEKQFLQHNLQITFKYKVLSGRYQPTNHHQLQSSVFWNACQVLHNEPNPTNIFSCQERRTKRSPTEPPSVQCVKKSFFLSGLHYFNKVLCFIIFWSVTVDSGQSTRVLRIIYPHPSSVQG